MNLFPRKRIFASRAEARRRRLRARLGVLAALIVVAGGGVYLANGLSGGTPDSGFDPLSEEGAGPTRGSDAGPREGAARADGGPETGTSETGTSETGTEQKKAPPEEPAPDPEQKTPEAAAFVAVAPEFPGVAEENVGTVYRSRMDPSWASVRITPEGENKDFIVFSHKEGDLWRAEKSIRADEPDYPDNDAVPLAGVPKDLLDYVYEENLFAAKVPEPKVEEVGGLPEVEPAETPPAEIVTEGVPEDERERIEEVAGRFEERVEGYDGVVGVYVQDLDGGFGYGVRADETFFSASIIKVPVMVAVYRKVDQGDLSFSQPVELKEEDWAAGAGWLQWEKAGTKQTVGDLLLLMMTQSDNVATNALIRMVGGREHVNEVAESLGAEDTLLYQKVSSERGAVPGLDNRTTPRDMATMLQEIADNEAASEKSCGYMIELMQTNELDWWLDAGLPEDVYAANKAGWLYQVYGDVGIVEHEGRRYTVAILSKHGAATVDEGAAMIEDLSRIAWESQGG
ncbi:MAG: Beta-lactamase class A-like and penicillin binding proteins (PBPs) superfamily [uncultured Rubrobacteraceae bacterium]|uniref:Beta-lactamase class A-like and penicillin binding proteins (PBPs) superfamily n=1 Tax=uncultured Rubrobacteraceae bacterium TaxID=349277 RepID=A0A6J4NSN2_9ACTN|nr:MAG: Beta-lactamase class A-like and penicillin binding proteins (PBPs) superfamily [uncultured Rubrobacteraceae bacterium]